MEWAIGYVIAGLLVSLLCAYCIGRANQQRELSVEDLFMLILCGVIWPVCLFGLVFFVSLVGIGCLFDWAFYKGKRAAGKS